MRYAGFQCKKGKAIAAALYMLCTVLPVASFAQTLQCGRAPFTEPDNVSALVSAMTPVFQMFPEFQNTLMQGGLELCIADKLIGLQGYFEPDNARIVMNGSAPFALQQAIIVHELRHVQQHRTDVCPAPDLSMHESARAVFAMEADASAISFLVAWAQRENGDPDMWNALSTWPMQQDIADAFAAEMNAENDIASATEAAFSQWYDSQARLDAYYVAACSNYLDIEDSNHRIRTYEELDSHFFENLCYLPNGAAYTCHDQHQRP